MKLTSLWVVLAVALTLGWASFSQQAVAQSSPQGQEAEVSSLERLARPLFDELMRRSSERSGPSAEARRASGQRVTPPSMPSENTSSEVEEPLDRPLDLGDRVEGEYHGDVISDARGPSREGVVIRVTRTGPNLVLVQASYSRLPSFETRLETVMHTIQGQGGAQVFLFDASGGAATLSITDDDVSWYGVAR